MKNHLIKTVLTAVTCLTGAVSAQANDANTFEGFYAGVQLGHESYDVDATETNVFVAGDSISYQLSGTGLNFGGFAGYGWRDGKAYGGVEVEGSIGGADTTVTYTAGGATGSSTIEHNHTLGLSARLGYLPNEETLLYARAGVVRSEFEQDGSESESLTGARVGLGAETVIDERTSIRADWSYTAYEDVRGIDITYEPSASIFRVGVSFAF